MNYSEFIARADLMVANTFPEWYVEGIRQELVFKTDIRFAAVTKLEDGTFVMYIYEQARDLCTVEDLASVLLHEYVHAKIWDDLEERISGFIFDDYCRSAIHEVTAYGVELGQKKIRTTGAMRMGTWLGYALHYNRAEIFCPEDLIKDFPEPEELR